MLSIQGVFSGTLRTAQLEMDLGARPNTIVFRGMDLVAGLLSGNRSLSGILYWAVGTGDPNWDAAPPPPNLRVRKLQNEIYRKRIEPGQLTYDSATKTMTVRVTFAPNEAVGTLREFGVFGGDASA